MAALLPVFSYTEELESDFATALEPLLSACMQCHGPQFEGRQQRMAPKLAGMETWYLERQLINFRDGIRGTHPDDGYGMQMNFVASMFKSNEEIQRFTEFVSSTQSKHSPVTVRGDVGSGRKLYATCAACHGHHGEGNTDLKAPQIAGQSDWYLVSQLRNFKAGLRGTHNADTEGKIMAAASNMLRDERMIRDLVAYINTFE